MAALMTSINLLVIASMVLLVSVSTADLTTQCNGTINLITDDPDYDAVVGDDSSYSNNHVISPDFPQSHPSPIDCELHISTELTYRVIVVNLTYFQMDEDQQNCTDYMEVYDGPSKNSTQIRKFCGNMVNEVFNTTSVNLTIIFHSDGLKNNSGFQFQYYDKNKPPRDPSEQCESGLRQANESNQFLTSPKYPSDYPINLNCQWVITASNSSLIALSVVSFDLPYPFGSSCTDDSVTLYDGNSTSSPRIATLCGVISRDKGQYKSTGPYLTFVFNSASYNHKGFNIGYKSLVKSVICPNTTLSANKVEKYITSPDYPSFYPSKMDCQWTIKAEDGSNVLALSLVDFDLPAGGSTNCSDDYVAIYDGYGTDSPRKYLLCDYRFTGFYFSSGPSITVVFHSDANINYLTGFNFTYSAKDKSDVCSKATLTATAAAQNFTSPGYPKNYPISMDCQWDITAAQPWEVVVLKPLDFHVDEYLLGCNSDYVIINESSSGSHSSYKICGENPNDKYTSTGPLMTVTFRSDNYRSYKGFNFEYTSQRKTAFCGSVTLQATSTVANLTSHGYPSPHPITMDCQWRISADPFYPITDSSSKHVVLELDQFSLAGGPVICPSDYVKIFDGPDTTSPELTTLCGQHSNRTFTSTKSQMTIVFHSEGGNSNTKGFNFKYHSKNSADSLATAQITFISLILLGFQILQ